MNGPRQSKPDHTADPVRTKPTASFIFRRAPRYGRRPAKHRRGQDNILLLEVDAAAQGEALKWEASRGGALFPHLYGPLPVSAVMNLTPLRLDDDGVHIFPDGFPPPGTE